MVRVAVFLGCPRWPMRAPQRRDVELRFRATGHVGSRSLHDRGGFSKMLQDYIDWLRKSIRTIWETDPEEFARESPVNLFSIVGFVVGGISAIAVYAHISEKTDSGAYPILYILFAFFGAGIGGMLGNIAIFYLTCAYNIARIILLIVVPPCLLGLAVYVAFQILKWLFTPL